MTWHGPCSFLSRLRTNPRVRFCAPRRDFPRLAAPFFSGGDRRGDEAYARGGSNRTPRLPLRSFRLSVRHTIRTAGRGRQTKRIDPTHEQVSSTLVLRERPAGERLHLRPVCILGPADQEVGVACGE